VFAGEQGRHFLHFGAGEDGGQTFGFLGADGVEDEVLTYMAFPAEHWTRIYSTNPLERLNREVTRRTDVVGIFPDSAAVIRLVGSVLIEINDEGQAGRRYFSQDSMRKPHEPEEIVKALPSPLRVAPIH